MKKNYLELANTVLTSILTEEIPFRLAVKNYLTGDKIEKEERKIIISLLGAELRHHLSFVNVLRKEFGDKEIQLFVPLLLLLSNHTYLKKIDEKEMLDYTMSVLSFETEEKQIENLLEKYVDSQSLLADTRPGSLEYLSLRFNTPGWLIKMWTKHFGRNETFKILKANVRQPASYLRINPLKANREAILNKYETYSPSSLEDVVIYVDKKPFKFNEDFKAFKLISTSLGIKHVVDQIDIDSLDKVAIYQDSPNSNLFVEVLLKANKQAKIDVAFTSPIDYQLVKDKMDEYSSLGDAKYFNISQGQLITVISEPVRKLFILSQSSNYQDIRTAPDYMIHFDQNKLDEYIAKEKANLDEAVELVDNGGDLIYMVTTLNNKEGKNLIKDFLDEHSEFTLVKEEQLLPFGEFECALYYAIMHKEASNGD